jgi:hypothetical protein
MGAEATKANISTKPIVISNAQKAHLLPLIRPDQIMNNASTERATSQELYRIVIVLSDAMTLAPRLAISDFSKTIPKSGEFPLRKTTMVNITEARKMLIPLHIERTIEPLFNILLTPCDVCWCPLFKVYSTSIYM